MPNFMKKAPQTWNQEWKPYLKLPSALFRASTPRTLVTRMQKIFIDFLWIQNEISRQKISRLFFRFRDFNFIGSICEHIVLFRGYIVLFGLCNFLFAQWISWPDCYRMSWWDDRSFISESELKKKPQKMRAQFGSKQSRGPHLIKERNHFITMYNKTIHSDFYYFCDLVPWFHFQNGCCGIVVSNAT